MPNVTSVKKRTGTLRRKTAITNSERNDGVDEDPEGLKRSVTIYRRDSRKRKKG